jgi:hypothetical protein
MTAATVVIQITKIILKGKKKTIKLKKKKTELSSQIPFSSPSAFPNGFPPLSSRREVKKRGIGISSLDPPNVSYLAYQIKGVETVIEMARARVLDQNVWRQESI